MLTFGNYLSERTFNSEEHTPPKEQSQNIEKIQDDNDFVKKKNGKISCRNQYDVDSFSDKSQNSQKYGIELSEKPKELDDKRDRVEDGFKNKLTDQENNNIKSIQAEGNNLLIMSPKNMKKRIEIMDFEKVEKESNEKERKMWQQNIKYPDQVSEWMSPSNSAMVKKAKSFGEVSRGQNGKNMDLRSASYQLLDLLLSLAITYGFSYLEENESDSSSKQTASNNQDQLTTKSIGIGFMVILIICQIVVGKMLNLSRNLTEGLMLCFQVGMFICYTEYRVVQLKQEVVSSQEESNAFLEMILIGGIYYSSFQQLVSNQRFFTKSSQSQSSSGLSSKAWAIIGVLISLSLVSYLLVRFYSTVRILCHVGVFLGLIIFTSLFLQEKSPFKCISRTREKNSQEEDETNTGNTSPNKNNVMNFNNSHSSSNNNNLFQMFSPKFGGFQVTSARHDKNPEFGGYFFNDKKSVVTGAGAAAAAASFAPTTMQLSSNDDRNILKQKPIWSDKNSSKNTSNSNNKPTSASIMSPKVFESVQCESPRDMLDSHRAIFFDTKDQNDGEEVGELEKAAAMYAEKNWGGKENDDQIDLQEDQEEEEQQARNKEKDKQEEQNEDEDEEADEEGLDIDLSDNINNGNVSLFNGERSDTIREPTNASAINMKTQDQHEPSAVNINQEEILWRLAMQDLILHSVNEGIVVIRKDSSEVIYANRQACHLLGTSIQYILPTLLQLRNVLSYKDEVLNFSEILQQFDKPPELSDLLNIRGMFSNLHNKREIMICVGQGANSNQGKQEKYFSHQNAGHQEGDENDTSFPGYSNSNHTNINILNSNNNNTDYHEVSFTNQKSRNDLNKNQNIKNKEFSSGNPSLFQPGQQDKDSQQKFSFPEQAIQGGFQQGSNFNDQNHIYSNQHVHNKSSSIKTFFDTCSFIAVEMEIVLGNFKEKFVLTTLRRMGWMNPLCAIHSSTLKVQYFIRKMISELSVDMNDMKDYFMNARLQPSTEAKVDVAGCLGKLECMAEFLQDFSTSSLIFSGTFMPIKTPLSLPALIGGVLNKISSRTANEAYKFTLEYDRNCPDVIFSDAKRLERVFYNLLLYFVDTNEQASVAIKVSSLSLLTNPDNKRLRKKANITNVYMLENMHYGVLLSSSLIQKLEPQGLGIFFRTGSQVSFSFKISIGQTM